MDDAADFSMIGPKGSSHTLPSSTILEGSHEDIFHNDENLVLFLVLIYLLSKVRTM
jgi:hypothetical protein